MKYFKVVNVKTGKMAANGFQRKEEAKACRNAMNLEAGYDPKAGKLMPFKVSKDVDHPKF